MYTQIRVRRYDTTKDIVSFFETKNNAREGAKNSPSPQLTFRKHNCGGKFENLETPKDNEQRIPSLSKP